MKRFLLILLFGVAGLSFANAQDPGNRAEKIEALKIAFITQKLNLTSDEAQRFWPVYNRYENDIKQVMRDNRNGGDAIDNEEKVLNVKKRYKPEFIKTLGEAKTNILFNSEREFRGILMRNLKNRQNKGPG